MENSPGFECGRPWKAKAGFEGSRMGAVEFFSGFRLESQSLMRVVLISVLNEQDLNLLGQSRLIHIVEKFYKSIFQMLKFIQISNK